MIRNIKAKFSKGVLIPHEKLALEEGKEVVISIADPSPLPVHCTQTGERTLEVLRATAGAWKGTHDPEALKQAIYSDRRITSRPQPKL